MGRESRTLQSAVPSAVVVFSVAVVVLDRRTLVPAWQVHCTTGLAGWSLATCPFSSWKSCRKRQQRPLSHLRVLILTLFCICEMTNIQVGIYYLCRPERRCMQVEKFRRSCCQTRRLNTSVAVRSLCLSLDREVFSRNTFHCDEQGSWEAICGLSDRSGNLCR